MNSATYPVITFEEFKELSINYLLEKYENYSLKDIFETLQADGFEKLDKDDLRPFVKSVFMYIEPVFVETGDNQFFWFVSGQDAMVVKKPGVKV